MHATGARDQPRPFALVSGQLGMARVGGLGSALAAQSLVQGFAYAQPMRTKKTGTKKMPSKARLPRGMFALHGPTSAARGLHPEDPDRHTRCLGSETDDTVAIGLIRLGVEAGHKDRSHIATAEARHGRMKQWQVHPAQ